MLQALQRQGVDAVAFDPAEQGWQQLIDCPPDKVFVMLHGGNGENGSVQGMLDVLAVPYTGSGVLACALGMDKLRSKMLWQSQGLPVPAWQCLHADSDWQQVADRLGLPLFVKPANEGSSFGINKVHETAALPQAFEAAAAYDSCVLAEQCISAGEYTVAIVGEQILPSIKIETGNDFYDYEAKYLRDDTSYLCPSGLSEAEEAQIQQLAWQAFQGLSGSGWGRVDFLRDDQGRFYLLEANMSPGMTDHSLVPMAAREVGISFDQLVLKILSLSGYSGHKGERCVVA